jgi:hypothetical protein
MFKQLAIFHSSGLVMGVQIHMDEKCRHMRRTFPNCSDGTLPLSRADEVARPGPHPPAGRHQRQVRVIPASRVFR